MRYQLGKIIKPQKMKRLFFTHLEGKFVWLEEGEPMLEKTVDPVGELRVCFCYKSHLEVWNPGEAPSKKLRFDKEYVELYPYWSIDEPLIPYKVWSRDSYSGIIPPSPEIDFPLFTT